MPSSTVAYRSGFVALVGRPNVGKSTLVNSLMRQKIAAVSPRPQTTRRRQLGILSLEQAQIVFVDTPGIHRPLHKLGEFMNQESLKALEHVDGIVWLVDASQPPHEEDRLVAAHLAALKAPPVILALNKIDLVKSEAERAKSREAFLAIFPCVNTVMLSALDGRGQGELLDLLIALLPPGEPLYDTEQITDLYERDIAADLVREAALEYLREEVPYSLAVRVDEYTERGDSGAFIHATIFVERDSHKGIVIGRGGEMLKKIGAAARRQIELMSGRKVFLELKVKVSKNWRNDPQALRFLGYVREENRK
ncbi:MAG: GTPase Era [Anaerolineae bacterium]|nr:GTPase Era [Anaerolineae bacterium]